MQLTSHLANDAANESGLKVNHQNKVYQCLLEANKPMSAMEIAAHTNITYVQVGKRTSELVEGSKIYVFDRKGISPSGYSANRYAVINNESNIIQQKYSPTQLF